LEGPSEDKTGVNMKKRLAVFFMVLTFLVQGSVFAQKKDRGKFQKRSNPFYSKVTKELAEFYAKKNPQKRRKSFVLDFGKRIFPTSLKEYKVQWHNPVESQARTNTCWSFSTVSFLESDTYRKIGKKIKLSQIYIVYNEYLEKATGFVRSRGHSYYPEGSESNAVTKVIKKYGIIPYQVYSGLKDGQPYHDHKAMHKEMLNYLKSIKKSSNWNLDGVLATIKAIMDHYIGTPPEKFTWEGKEYCAKSFAKEYLKLNADEYVDILSYLQQPFYQQVEYEVPDNWWHDKSYHNVPVKVFMKTLKSIIKRGYTVVIGGDVSEPGYNAEKEVGIVPTFDIPRDYIDDHARQFRFSNRTTTDDHGVHIVGYTEYKGDMWFVIKDSGSGARNGKNVGYRFIREDYVKLKFMDFMVHRSAVEDLLKKFK
jgi:bleomycin hydrolase